MRLRVVYCHWCNGYGLFCFLLPFWKRGVLCKLCNKKKSFLACLSLFPFWSLGEEETCRRLRGGNVIERRHLSGGRFPGN